MNKLGPTCLGRFSRLSACLPFVPQIFIFHSFRSWLLGSHIHFNLFLDEIMFTHPIRSIVNVAVLLLASAVADDSTPDSTGCVDPSGFEQCYKANSDALTTCVNTVSDRCSGATDECLAACGNVQNAANIGCWVQSCWNHVNLNFQQWIRRCSLQFIRPIVAITNLPRSHTLMLRTEFKAPSIFHSIPHQ